MNSIKIPKINNDFDVAVFLQLLKKKYYLILISVVLSLIAAFLYLRYTPPLFSSSSIVQINESNKNEQILDIKGMYKNEDILKNIELLRSKEFLKKALSKLPLAVSYHVEGSFLSTELYKQNPFTITHKKPLQQLYEKPIYIDFIDKENAKIRVGEKDAENIQIKINQWQVLFGDSIKCSIENWQTIEEKKEKFKNNHYFFIVHNAENVINHYVRQLDISLLNKSAQTIKISYADYNAYKTADVVNTIAKEYIAYDAEIKKESAKNTLFFIEQQLENIYQILNHTEREIFIFKTHNSINSRIFENAQENYTLQKKKISDFENELLNIQLEELALKRINKQIKNNEEFNIYEIIASFTGTKSEPIVVNVLNNLQQLINEKEQLLSKVTHKNLKVKRIDQQIAQQKQLLFEFVNTTLVRLKDKKIDYEKQIDSYEQKLFSKKKYDELELSKLERLYKVNEEFYNKLIEKKAEIMIAQAGYVSQNTILEMANVVRIPTKPLKNQSYIYFFLIGLFFSFSILLFKYLLYDEVTSISTISKYTNAPILGTIPIYKKNLSVSQLLVNKKPNSVFTEAFRTIRSNLQFISHGAETKIITVSSTISGEGKTFVAINLGGIIATSGRKVLILDLDLRKPRIHLAFNVDNSKGMSTLLIGKNEIKECVLKTDIENFDFITAGPIPPNPSELANSKAMQDILDELEEHYDFIIIDTPPVGIVSDALSNLQRANYPIYVMKANVSKRHFIENANRLVHEKNIANLSIILNGIELNQKNYGYGYGYGYYTEEKESISKKLTKRLKKLKK